MSNFFFPTDLLFDSHCHLNDPSFDVDRDEVVKRASWAGVERIVDVAVDVESARRVVANARRYAGVVYAALGIDPDVLIPGGQGFVQPTGDAQAFWQEQMLQVRALIQEHRDVVVAIGETGMDKYWVARNPGSKPTVEDVETVMQKQEMLFRKHLELAVETKLPLTIHSRACEEDCLRIVKDYPQARGIFHSYTGSYQTAKQILDAGWALGVNGIVTFKNGQELRSTYKKILGDMPVDIQPADLYAKGIYLETDAPYLAPQGKRGERNEPGGVIEVKEGLGVIVL